jgi:hypothetical protein
MLALLELKAKSKYFAHLKEESQHKEHVLHGQNLIVHSYVCQLEKQLGILLREQNKLTHNKRNLFARC